MSKSKKTTFNIKKTIGYSLVLGVCVIGSYNIGKNVGQNSPLTSKYYPSNKVIATVNGKDIYSDSFKANMNILFHMERNKKFTKDELQNEESQYLDYLTLNKALYEVATKSGIVADKNSVEQSYLDIMSSLTETLYMSESEILKKFDLTKEFIIKSLSEDFVVTKYLEDNSIVSEEELLDYYNNNINEFTQYKSSHILIATTDKEGNALSIEQKESAKQEALTILEKVHNNESFEQLAKDFSDDDTTASEGGDLGYFIKGDMVDEFQKAVEEIEIGEIHKSIIETNYGYHIVKKTDQFIESFEDVKENISNQLIYEKQSELIKKIRKESKIEILYGK